MSAASTGSNIVAVRYATAILDLAAQNEAVQAVEGDIASLSAMLRESEDLRDLTQNPLISRDVQGKAIAALAQKAGFHDLTVRFLGVLAQNRRLNALTGIIAAFANELRRRRGEELAKVESAYPLSAAQTQTLQAELTQALGRPVSLDVTVNKDLLGGMTVMVGSRMIDDSVRTKLDHLQRAMTNGAARPTQIKEVG